MALGLAWMLRNLERGGLGGLIEARVVQAMATFAFHAAWHDAMAVQRARRL